MVSERVYNYADIAPAHLIKHCTDGMTLPYFGIDDTEIDNPRNGMLMYRPIEQAFDRKQLCFIYNPFNQAFVVKVLKPDLLREELFQDIDGKSLRFPPDRCPYRRILSMHAKFSFSKAYKKQWITEDVVGNFRPYFELSEHGRSEPLGLGSVLCKDVYGLLFKD
jgi:hypothetical protein